MEKVLLYNIDVLQVAALSNSSLMQCSLYKRDLFSSAWDC